MKRCPVCKRGYDDEMIYCLEDGSRLVAGNGSEPATAILNAVLEPGTMTFEAQKRGENAIAVLPFLNLSRDEEDEYFSDGLAEELLNVLSRIRGLRVAARTSAFSFKGKQSTVAEIGRALNVSSVLEGSIRKAGERMRISVQLVNASDGYQLWSETYDRTMHDIFAVQDDIAQCVVAELRTVLGEQAKPVVDEQIISEIAVAVDGRADDPEAQRLMMLGRYYLDRTTREDTKRAVGYLKRAVEVDPEYALGWAEIARAYSIEAGRGWAAVDEAFRRSREAVDRALELKPDLAEAHAQLGRIKAAHEWDLVGAEACYKRAIELAPGSSAVLDGASILAYKLGRLDDALELSRRVLLHDPLRTAFWHNLGLTCHAAGLLDEAERAFRRAVDFAPQRLLSSSMLSLVLMDQGRAEDAAAEAAKEPDEFWRTWSLAIIWHRTGKTEEADRALSEIVERFADGNAYQIAEVYAVRGESDKAFQWLDRAQQERDAGITHAKVSPRLALLHKDERWTGLLAGIGLQTGG